MFGKRNVITLGLLEYSWVYILMSIVLWAQEAIFTQVWVSRYEKKKNFCGLMGSQRTPEFWGITEEEGEEQGMDFLLESCVFWMSRVFGRNFSWRLVAHFSRVLWRDHLNPRILEVSWEKP